MNQNTVLLTSKQKPNNYTVYNFSAVFADVIFNGLSEENCECVNYCFGFDCLTHRKLELLIKLAHLFSSLSNTSKHIEYSQVFLLHVELTYKKEREITTDKSDVPP